ncbi:MAG: protein kinase, partial [Planctomycetota bacterium]|nr:protein kinase [Planctomycetota bacterium]
MDEGFPCVGAILANRYVLEKILGEGGMGIVYEAKDQYLNGEMIAVKVVREDLMPLSQVRQRFLKEISIVRQLRHENIVQIFDIGEASGGAVLFYTMERLSGQTLRQRLQQSAKGIAFREICEFLPAVLAAVQFAHSKGVLHRDLKPENIFLCDDKTPRLLDFGLLKILEDESMEEDVEGTLLSGGIRTSSRIGFGTPCYAAPEQAAEASSVDERADIYSLGVILYECLTGTRPIGIFEKASEICRDAPEDVDVLLENCLQQNRERRYSNLSELVSDFGVLNVKTGAPPTSARKYRKKSRTTEEPTPASSRRKTRLSSSLLAVIILVALAAIVLLLLLALPGVHSKLDLTVDSLPKYTQEQSIEIVGKASRGSVVIGVGDLRATVDDSGQFSLEVPLIEGVNKIRILVNSSDGEEVSKELSIERDSTPPEIRWVQRGMSPFSRARSSIFAGTVIDNNPSSLEINGELVELGPGGTFRAKIVGAELLYKIPVIAKDKAGNKTIHLLRWEKGRTEKAIPKKPQQVVTPIEIQKLSINDDLVYADKTFRLEGVVNYSFARLEVGTKSVLADSKGAFLMDLEISEARTNFTLHTVASNGASLTKEFTVILDEDAPALKVLNEVEGELIKVGEFDSVIKGRVAEANLLDLKINEDLIPVDSTGLFRYSFTPSNNAIPIKIVAKDKAGHVTTLECKIVSPSALKAFLEAELVIQQKLKRREQLVY